MTGATKLQILIADASTAKRKYEWAEVVKGYKVYACHSAQLDILASKAKFTFAFAGSGGGKTCLIPLWLFKQIAKKPNGRFLVVSPTVNTFESSELKRHIIGTFQDTAYEGEWKESKKTYALPTGGEIVVKTVGDGGDFAKLTGGQYDAAVADECYLLSGEVWEEIRRRVSNRNGQILAVTTPTGNNWIWDVKQKAEAGDVDYFVKHWSKTANPTVSATDVAREKGLMSAARYARMVEGNFSAFEGLIYDCFGDPTDADLYPVIDGDPLRDGFPGKAKPVRFFGGNDWGYKPDPASVIIFAECEDRMMYAVEEIYGTEIANDALSKRVREMVDRWAVRVDSQYVSAGGAFTTFWSDVSRPEHSQAFRAAGIPIRNKRVTDVLAGIAATDKWFRSGRLKVYSKCENLIRECRSYQWNKDRIGGLKDTPLAKNDHACDALRYAISSHKYGVDPSPIVRATLDEVAELEKAQRYGLYDPVAAAAEAKERDERMENERFRALLYADMD